MLKSEYDVFKYVSINQLLHSARPKYAHSYQYTETDGMDLTYYQRISGIIIHRAVTRLLQHVDDWLPALPRLTIFVQIRGLSRLKVDGKVTSEHHSG